MGGFRRSGLFGLIGVVIVAVVVAVIASTMGSGQARPKLALGLIFGVIALFVGVFFVLQARDVSRVEAASVPDAGERTPAGEIGDPTSLSEPDLWASLAIAPITEEAARARTEIWGTVRSSMRLGRLITLLIFLSVVPMYLFDTFVPILIGAPLIGLIALWKSFGLLRGGGVLDQSYDRVGVAMAPLGLDLVERPTVWFKPRLDRPLFSTDFSGATVMAGRRHGRDVSVCFPAGGSGVRSPSAVTLGDAVPELEVRCRDGRLHAERGAPAGVGRALGSLPTSSRWKGVRVEGGAEGLIVYRTSSGEGDWLCDLWLAERIADAVGARATAT